MGMARRMVAIAAGGASGGRLSGAEASAVRAPALRPARPRAARRPAAGHRHHQAVRRASGDVLPRLHQRVAGVAVADVRAHLARQRAAGRAMVQARGFDMPVGQPRRVVGGGVLQGCSRVGGDPALEQRAVDESVAEGAVPAAAAGAEGADAAGQGAAPARGGGRRCAFRFDAGLGVVRRGAGGQPGQPGQMGELLAAFGSTQADQSRAMRRQPEHRRRGRLRRLPGARRRRAARFELGAAGRRERCVHGLPAAGQAATDLALQPLQRQQRLAAQMAGVGLAGGLACGCMRWHRREATRSRPPPPR